MSYDTENRLVAVSGAATASFLYDTDGKQVIVPGGGVLRDPLPATDYPTGIMN